MSRFYCTSCWTHIHDTKIKFVLLPPPHPAPWAPFEGELYPAPCPVCGSELTDALSTAKARETLDRKRMVRTTAKAKTKGKDNE
jgi:hypothetical protein